MKIPFLNNQRGDVESALAIGIGTLVIAGIVGLIIWGSTFRYQNQQTVHMTIKDKERVVDQHGSSAKYLIYTENETFENTDALWVGKFNSSDLYGKLDPGKTYDCQVMGYRLQYFSTYRDIISCSPAITPSPSPTPTTGTK